jgi:hypothetical protein
MKRIIHFIPLLILLMAGGCTKVKTDARAGNLPTYSNLAKSQVRLISLGFLGWSGSMDLMVDTTKLTNWYSPPANGMLLPYPTPYFPATGKFSGVYSLPQEFLDANGQATVKLMTAQTPPAPDVLLDSFIVQNNYQHPWDYYVGTSLSVNGTYQHVTAVPRTISPASDPTHIRIRLVNLSANSSSVNLSLAFADGTRVSDTSSGVADYSWSDYVELPYGTYQFKVLVDGTNMQVPGLTPKLMAVNGQNDYSIGGTQVYYVPIMTYQPGGVYTVVIAISAGSYEYNFAPAYPSCLSIVTDVTPSVNLSFARVQAVNAAVSGGLNMQIDGGAAIPLAYGTAGDYLTLVTGTHSVKIMDGSGKSLADNSITVKGGDNNSLWIYPTASGTGMTVTPNNMSGVRDIGTNSDGSDPALGVYDPLNFGMRYQMRFLNLCPDLPYVTFTDSNGALFSDGQFQTSMAAQNLQPGLAPDAMTVPYPYVNNPGGTVQAYGSLPLVVPGDRLTGVPALGPADFVRMSPFFFHNGNFATEPGVYTVALIGHSNAKEQPKMIVVKHNK